MGTILGGLVAKAKTFGGGSYIQDGKYLFAVERFFEQKGYEGDSCIAELRVLEATQLDDKVKPNPVGSACSVVWNVTKNKEAALSNIKKFLMAMFDVGEDEITDESYANAVDEESNPLRGMVIRCETIKVTNKGKVNAANRGMVMTVPKFLHVEQGEDDVKSIRAELDKLHAKAEQQAAPKEPEPKAAATGKKLLGGILGKR